MNIFKRYRNIISLQNMLASRAKGLKFAMNRGATFVPRPAWKKPRRASGFI